MIDNTILSILFSTVAALVATLTGLMGGFATFRLQRIDVKLDFLKDYMLHKEVRGTKTLNQRLRDAEYRHIEKIYLHNMEAVTLLKNIVEEFDYHRRSHEYEHDINNIERHQRRYDKIKKVTSRDFFLSMSFVFLTLGLLVATKAISAFSLQWLLLLVFFLLAAFVFYGFISQVKTLIE